MSTKNEKIGIFALNKEIFAPSSGEGWFVYPGDKGEERIDTAIKTFASNVNKKEVIGFVDTTLLRTGKKGCLFTNNALYYYEPPVFSKGEVKYVAYKDILMIEVPPYDQKSGIEYLDISLRGGLSTEIKSADFVICFIHSFLTMLLKSDYPRFIETRYNGQYFSAHAIDVEKVENKFLADIKKDLKLIAKSGAAFLKKIADSNSKNEAFTEEQRQIFSVMSKEFEKIEKAN